MRKFAEVRANKETGYKTCTLKGMGGLDRKKSNEPDTTGVCPGGQGGTENIATFVMAFAQVFGVARMRSPIVERSKEWPS